MPKNRLLIDIIDRYLGEKSSGSQVAKCQLCHSSEEQLMTWVCEQCQIGYCDQCREQYHPMRGPYAKHNLVHPSELSFVKERTTLCARHVQRLAEFYCVDCQIECCQQCSSHVHHELISIQQAAKTYKVRLRSTLFSTDESIKEKKRNS